MYWKKGILKINIQTIVNAELKSVKEIKRTELK